MIPLGETLRRTREAHGESVRKCAAAVGLSSSYYSKLERGVVAPPSVETLDRIAAHLHLDLIDVRKLAGRNMVEIDAEELERLQTRIDELEATPPICVSCDGTGGSHCDDDWIDCPFCDGKGTPSKENLESFYWQAQYLDRVSDILGPAMPETVGAVDDEEMARVLVAEVQRLRDALAKIKQSAHPCDIYQHVSKPGYFITKEKFDSALEGEHE